MADPIDREVLARYLTGVSPPAEAERVRAWLAAHPEQRMALEDRTDLPAAFFEYRDTDAALASMRERMAEPTADHRPTQARPKARRSADRTARRRSRRRPLARTTAILLLLALAVMLAYPLTQRAPENEAFQEIATQRGQRQTVHLPDGTTVTLNVASRLRVPEAFTEDRRAVTLDGSAFFDVTADARRPFVVRTGRATVEVLGTAFGVNAYAEDAVTSVVVEEGRVAVRPSAAADPSPVVLSPNEQAVVSGGDAAGVAVEVVDAARLLGWRRGMLVFEGTPLPAVARALERWYDAEVVLASDGLNTLRLDATVDDEPLSRAARTIAAALELDVQIDGQHVRFSLP